MGGTDYIKPKDYGASQYKGQSHYSKPQSSHSSQAKPKPHSSSSAQERGDASIPDEFKIPPEIAAAMDPQELAMQIQMFEELAKKHQRKLEREAVRESKSMSQKKPAEERQSTGFTFERFEADNKHSNGRAAEERKKSSQKPPVDDGFFNSDSVGQGGAATFDFDFGGVQPKPASSGPKEQKPKDPQPASNNVADLLDLLSFDAPSQPVQQPPQPQSTGSDLFGGINLALSAPQQPVQVGSAEQQSSEAPVESKPKFVPNLNSFMTAQPQMMQANPMQYMGGMPMMNAQQQQYMQMMLQQ